MKPIRVMIVDDEPIALEGIAAMLEGDREVVVVETCSDGEAALNGIRRQRPDLVFLDVQMPRLDGFEALARLDPAERPEVIFVTAHDRYAIQAFELNALDYLLKPFRDGRFRAALERAKERIRQSRPGEGERPPKELREGPRPAGAGDDKAARLWFKVGRDYLFVDPAEIVFVEAQGVHVRLVAGGRTLLVREALQTVAERLGPGRFLRVHRSFIVNRERIAKITPALYGDYTLVMSDGARIRLSRSYRDKLRVLLPGHFA